MPETIQVYKAYVIIYDADYVYVPIKSAISPYQDGGQQYCACMPNFFGGNRRYSDGAGGRKTLHSCAQTLIKEIKEESQGKFELKRNIAVDDGGPMHGHTTDRGLPDGKTLQEHMNFYWLTYDMLEVHTAGFDADGICVLDKAGANADEKEHSHILRVSKQNITGSEGAGNIDKFVTYCQNKGFCDNAGGRTDFNDSSTKSAFTSFLRQWPL